MANTSALQEAIEWVHGTLAAELGMPVSKANIRLRPGRERRFNAVSADGRLVATVMNSSGATSGGKKPVGKVRGALAELYLLSLVDAPQRLLIATNPDFFSYIVSETDGALAEGLTLRLMELPPDIEARVRSVTSDASQEMTA